MLFRSIVEKNKRSKVKEYEKGIALSEKELEDIDKLLCDPEIYDKHVKIVELTRKRGIIEKNLNNLYISWIKSTES